MNKGLGRRIQFDERSRAFPIRALLPTKPPRSYTWGCTLKLDQGSEGSCVGHAFAHEAAARPVKVKNLTSEFALAVYNRARELDEWPGEDYDGTSILAGVKACMERAWYKEYRWAFGLQDLILAIGYQGPAVLGLNWYEGMAECDRSGFVQVTGDILGGHAILAHGVNVKHRFVKLVNSWGESWGQNGECKISFEDLDRLLHEQGEACIPIGRKL